MVNLWNFILDWLQDETPAGPGATCYDSSCLWHDGSRCTRYRSCQECLRDNAGRIDVCRSYIPSEEFRDLLKLIEEDRGNSQLWATLRTFSDQYGTVLYEVVADWSKDESKTFWEQSPCRECSCLGKVEFTEWLP